MKRALIHVRQWLHELTATHMELIERHQLLNHPWEENTCCTGATMANTGDCTDTSSHRPIDAGTVRRALAGAQQPPPSQTCCHCRRQRGN